MFIVLFSKLDDRTGLATLTAAFDDQRLVTFFHFPQAESFFYFSLIHKAFLSFCYTFPGDFSV